MIEIRNNAFGDNKITSVEIPFRVNKIATHAFYLNQINKLDLSNAINLTNIEENAFRYNKLTSVEIPDSVETIGMFAFEGNNLTYVGIGSGITYIEDYAFGDAGQSEQGIGYGSNEIKSVKANKSSQDSYLLERNTIFSWASGYDISNIIWLQSNE